MSAWRCWRCKGWNSAGKESCKACACLRTPVCKTRAQVRAKSAESIAIAKNIQRLERYRRGIAD